MGLRSPNCLTWPLFLKPARWFTYLRSRRIQRERAVGDLPSRRTNAMLFSINKLLLTGRQLAKGRQLAQTSRQETFCDALELAAHDAPRTPNSRPERVNRILNPRRCLGRSVSDLNARIGASKLSPPQSSPAHPCLLICVCHDTHCQLA